MSGDTIEFYCDGSIPSTLLILLKSFLYWLKMHEPYDEDEDEGYPDDDFNNDWSNPLNPKTWYYKFDIGPNTPISSWLVNMINQWWGGFGFDIENSKFPVNSWNPSTDKGNSFQYLGSNYQGSPIWKKQYFVVDSIYTEYKLHIQKYAANFMSQPTYYKGLFDILN